ncbi:hypothetical protein J7E68_16190, partial [Microbacterium sp. ISL-103]|uniref:hypothetical protein n=1 Tax=Microbacterium sp. ISL-103 TaxID=2819156 RepID=UPI001BECB920
PAEAEQIASTAAPGNHIQVLWDERGDVIAAHPMILPEAARAISGRCEGNYARSFHLIGGKQQIFCYGGKGTWTGARGGFFKFQTTGLATTVTFDTGVTLAVQTCAANSTCSTIFGGNILTKLTQ